MSKIWHYTPEFKSEKKIVLTIGTFDGVHIGHQKIINRLLEHKKLGFETAILTFDPHPRKILFPNQTDLKLLTSNKEKIELLKSYDIDHIIIQTFDLKFSSLSSEEYIVGILKQNLNVNKLIIGYDHRFGKNREGNINLLQEFSKNYNFTVEEIPAKDIDSINISSSLIRKSLENGEIKKANKYLGYNFFITAKVVEGKKLGRTLGFPTANLSIEDPDKIIPKNGVYAVIINIGNEKYQGMLNIGLNPTVESTADVKIETHIFNFSKSIYTEILKVEFIDYLRPEKKFNNLEELISQLSHDKLKATEILSPA